VEVEEERAGAGGGDRVSWVCGRGRRVVEEQEAAPFGDKHRSPQPGGGLQRRGWVGRWPGLAWGRGERGSGGAVWHALVSLYPHC